MTHTTQPSYEEFTEALANSDSSFQPAQVHGLFCGYICANSGAEESRWEKIILGKNKNIASREMLQQLYEFSYQQMNEFSFEFMLLLPDDEEDINTRTEALGLWCQGFLAGLEQSNIKIKRKGKDEFTETLNNLIEIAQVTYGDLEENEEDETAYFELVEYVRLAALMVFQELSSKKTPKDPDQNTLLH
jgi:uncharacterized protein YgfB (UPF0149 family)